MAKLKVVVEPSLCTGEALCTGISPRYFELVDSSDGIHRAQVRDPLGQLHVSNTQPVDDDGYDQILEAAERCPPKAIYVYEIDDDGNETRIFP